MSTRSWHPFSRWTLGVEGSKHYCVQLEPVRQRTIWESDLQEITKWAEENNVTGKPYYMAMGKNYAVLFKKETDAALFFISFT